MVYCTPIFYVPSYSSEKSSGVAAHCAVNCWDSDIQSAPQGLSITKRQEPSG
jgi:hypothetical protein